MIPNADTIETIVSCGNCGSVYRASQAPPECRNCNGELSEPVSPVDLSRKPRYVGSFAFLKPVAEKMEAQMTKDNMLKPAGSATLAEQMEGPVRCGWCRTHLDQRPGSPNCPSCGGVLPLPPGSDPGPPPAAGPRKLPKGFKTRLYGKQNLSGWVGVIIVLISFPMMLVLIGFPLFILGLIQAWYGFNTAYRQQRALTHGEPILGRIESVVRFGPEKPGNHGETLYRVYVRFDTDKEGLLGLKWTYDPAITKHFLGEPVWVVANPKKPQYYAIWPPLA